MVFSRPMWSDTQPKNGHVSPLVNATEHDRQQQRRHSEHQHVGDLELLGQHTNVEDHHQAAGVDVIVIMMNSR